MEVRQRWANPYAQPLRVRYQLPLPADGAVSGYSFTVGERTSIAKIARKQEAREAFEEAVAQGHSAALLDQERSSLFTQELGNIPPGEEIIVRVELDQPLSWNATAKTAGLWEWRFPTVIAPRYLGAPGRFEDAEAVTVGISEAKASAMAEKRLRFASLFIGNVCLGFYVSVGSTQPACLQSKSVRGSAGVRCRPEDEDDPTYRGGRSCRRRFPGAYRGSRGLHRSEPDVNWVRHQGDPSSQ